MFWPCLAVRFSTINVINLNCCYSLQQKEKLVSPNAQRLTGNSSDVRKPPSAPNPTWMKNSFVQICKIMCRFSGCYRHISFTIFKTASRNEYIVFVFKRGLWGFIGELFLFLN